MSVSTNVVRSRSQLRAEANFRLKIGVAAGANWTLSADTLGLLFKLASSPDTMMDGLKLLHELQTHQVELEMQHQELEQSALLHDKQHGVFKSLFDDAPFGYLVVQGDGMIVQSNWMAAQLLGLKTNACNGRQFESFCTVLSAYALRDLLKHVVVDGPPTMCVIELKPAKERPKRVQLLISKSPDTECFYFGLSSYDQLLKV